MTNKATVDDFLAQHTLALVGASRDPKGIQQQRVQRVDREGLPLDPSQPESRDRDG